MSSADTPAGTDAVARSGSLIQPASVESLLNATRGWDKVDVQYTQAVGALTGAISDARKDLSNRGFSGVSEEPGATAASAGDAITRVNAARQRMANAAQARIEAKAQLNSAREAAEKALGDASDVLLARRAIAAAAVFLLALMLWVTFRG